MPQENSKEDFTATIRIPDNLKTQVIPAEETPEKETNPVRRGDSTVLDSLLDNIFSQEEVPPPGELSIQADSSIGFRSSLELSGKKYKLEKLVASGGFGQIFQVEDRVLGRKAIVKTLKEEFLDKEEAVEHFISEAKLSSQLDHPGIVPLFSLDTDSNNGLHLAMQQIRGITLKVYLMRCRDLQLKEHFPQKLYDAMLKERMEIFLRICDTIYYCHSRGVLHNDLKPENIMIGRYGQVYVMDWGIASMEGGEKPERNMGSPSYMAPERICSRTLSCRTDIFSLGMILNELATLRPAIDGASVSEVLERICTGQFEPSTCIDPKRHISVVLRAIIEKARSADPRKRYDSVQALANDVRRFLQREETAAYPDSFIQKIFRFLFHHRRFTLSMASGIVLLFIIALFFNFYNASMITHRANRETLRKLRWAKSTDEKGGMIGKYLLLYQEKTANMGSALAIEVGKKHYDSNAPFYWNENFAPGSRRRPPGMVHTIASRGGALTLSTGTFYSFRDQISQEEIQDWANNFHAQQSLYSANVLEYVRQKEITYKADKLKLFYEYGSTVQRIVCVLNNGLVYSYPGKYAPKASQESFLPEHIRRELQAGKESVWSSPYLDPESGLIVASCWHTIRTLRGSRIGTIGTVVVFEDLLRDFLAEVRKEKEPAVYALVDSETRMIYSTARNFDLTRQHQVLSGEGTRKPLFYKWYSEVIRRIRENPGQNQFSAVLDGRHYNITWRVIPSSNWLFIRHVPVENRLGNGRRYPKKGADFKSSSF